MTQKAYNPFSLDDLVKDRGIARIARKAFENAIGLGYLAKNYAKVPLAAKKSESDFLKHAFRVLGIRYKIRYGSVTNVPTSGPVVIVSNHPTGGLDGMLMIDLLIKQRKDIRILANGMLSRIPEIGHIFLAVNPYGTKKAVKENVSAMKEAIKWLQGGGALVVFPAGDVSLFQAKSFSITDGPWDKSIVRIAELGGADILPVHIKGKNSLLFYLTGIIHPLLKSPLLPRQLLNKKNQILSVSIGNIISLKKLEKFSSHVEKMEYLKMKTYLLAENKENSMEVFNDGKEPILDQIDPELIHAEIRNIPSEQMLIDGDLQVYYARNEQMPWTVREIGRLREITFRDVGEGTGKSIDLDLFDNFYIHLFIWDKSKQMVVGSYRLGLSDEIQAKFGKKGFYSHTLFHFNHELLNRIKPAIELGRSFIRPEYQKSFSPLFLLWKGIALFVSKNPKYTTLFGPVSVSNEYSDASRDLIVKYFNKKAQLKNLVRARQPYQYKTKRHTTLQNIADTSIEELSGYISHIEEDGKGIPVLIRQYLKLGGKILAFNIDPEFNNCIDGFIMVDLRETDFKVLSKYMGKDELNAYLEYHKNNAKKETKKRKRS